MAGELVLFDLDNTLLEGDSDEEWFEFLIAEKALDRDTELAAKDSLMRRYRDGAAGAVEFCEFFLRCYVPHGMERLLAWRERFVRECILPRISAAARELVAGHRRELCVIITATNRFLTEPIALELGVPNLIATEPEIEHGRFTGRVAGTPCFREGKIERLAGWLAGRGQSADDFPIVRFYSDSINDAPLLARATHPVAVDPDPQLERLALERGWPVLRLRRRAA